MKTSLSNVLLQRSLLWALALASTGVACGRGNTLRGDSLLAPTLATLVPGLTRDPNLAVSGTRPAGSQIVAVFEDGTEQILAPAGNQTSWSGEVHLQEGSNTFRIIARRPTGQSDPSGNYTVVLDTIPPASPTVDTAYLGIVYFYYVGNSNYTVTGTKATDGDLKVNGTGYAATGPTTWSGPTIQVDASTNQVITVVSTDAAGNASVPLSITIKGTNTPPPVIDAASYHTPTRIAALDITGTKRAGDQLHYVFNGSAPAAHGTPASTTFALPALTMTAQGNNQVVVYQVDGSGAPSPYAIANIVYDTVPPLPPSLTSPPHFDVADPNHEPILLGDGDDLVLSGSLPADGSLCVTLTPQGATCIAQANAGGNFTVNVPLPAGQNDVYVSARDEAGNISQELQGSVYVVSPPSVTVTAPGPNSVLSSTSLTVEVTATPNTNDTGVAGAAISTVRVCFDMTCENAAGTGGSYTVALDLSNPAPSPGQHTVTVTVTGGAGVQAVVSLPVSYASDVPTWVSLTQALPRSNTTTAESTDVRSALDANGTLHVVWEDSCMADGKPQCVVNGKNPPDIFYRQRAASGAWSVISVVSSTGTDDGESKTPSVAVDASGVVHVVWVDSGTVTGRPASGQRGVVHRALNPTTQTWGAIDVPGGTDLVNESVMPAVVGDPNRPAVHVTFSKIVGTRHDIYYTRLLAGAWTTPLQLSVDPSNVVADFPSVAVSPKTGHAHVAWHQCTGVGCFAPTDVYAVAVTNPNASSVSAAALQRVSDNALDGDSRRPTLAFDPTDPNDVMIVAWDDTATVAGASGRNVFLRKYIGGAAESNTYEPITASGGQADSPSIAVGSDGTLVVAWSETMGGGDTDIKALMGTAALGVDASQGPIPVVTDTGRATKPWAVVEPNQNASVVWQDFSHIGGASPTSTTSGINPPDLAGVQHEAILYRFILKP